MSRWFALLVIIACCLPALAGAQDSTAKVVPYGYAAFNAEGMTLSRVGAESNSHPLVFSRFPAKVRAFAEYNELDKRVNYAFCYITPDQAPWFTLTIGQAISPIVPPAFPLFRAIETIEYPYALLSPHEMYTIYVKGVAGTIRFPTIEGIGLTTTVHRQVYENRVIANLVLSRQRTVSQALFGQNHGRKPESDNFLNLFWEEYQGAGAVLKWKFHPLLDLTAGASAFQHAKSVNDLYDNAWFGQWRAHLTPAVRLYYQYDEFNLNADGPKEVRRQAGVAFELWKDTRLKLFYVNDVWSPAFAIYL